MSKQTDPSDFSADSGLQAGNSTDLVAAANELCRNTLVDRMGIEFCEVSATRLVATMPVAGNIQPYGLLHGGAHGVLAETLGSVGAGLSAGPGRMGVGIDLNASHHRPATAGVVRGVAERVHVGRTLCTYEVVISDERGRRLCTARLTCYLTDVSARRVPKAAPLPPTSASS